MTQYQASATIKAVINFFYKVGEHYRSGGEMKKITTVFLLFVLFSLASYAHGASFLNQCADLGNCIKFMSTLTGNQYVFGTEIKNKAIHSTDNVEITPENAEILFTKALHSVGFTRVPLGQPKTYQILSIQEACHTALPSVVADEEVSPGLPPFVWDIYQLTYQVKNPELLSEMEKISKDILSPQSTFVVSIKANSQLLLMAPATELVRIYEIISQMDLKKTTPSHHHRDQDKEKGKGSSVSSVTVVK